MEGSIPSGSNLRKRYKSCFGDVDSVLWKIVPADLTIKKTRWLPLKITTITTQRDLQVHKRLVNMNSSIVLIIGMLCMYMCRVHIVEALPLRADTGIQLQQAPPTISFRDPRETADGETETSSTETDDASVSESILSSGSAGSGNQSVCEPCTEAAEKVAEENTRKGNVLYPFSAMAELLHSQQRRRRETGSDDRELHRDVCNQIKGIANQNLPDHSETPCPWEYECTYRSDIFPHYILEASCSRRACTYPLCNQDTESSNTDTRIPPSGRSCQPYKATYRVLQVPQNGCDGGDISVSNFTNLDVNFGCSCVRI